MNITGYKNKKKNIIGLKSLTEKTIEKIRNKEGEYKYMGGKVLQKKLIGQQAKLERLRKANLDCSKRIKQLKSVRKKR